MHQLSFFSEPSPADLLQNITFAANKQKPVHRWVPWVAGFSSELVCTLLATYAAEESVVLDPFAGVGTTLLDAYCQGHQVIGFEVNPYAAFVSRVKLGFAFVDPAALRTTAQQLQQVVQQQLAQAYVPRTQAPQGFKTKIPFFSPRVLRKILICLDFVEQVDHAALQACMQLAFALTMIEYSNYSYEPSLSTRQAAGKNTIPDAPIVEIIARKLQEMADDIETMCTQAEQLKSYVVYPDSCLNSGTYVKQHHVDLCITSPPYLNNYHYVRNTRPQMYWLGLVSGTHDTKKIEHANFGKYWQTVRDLTHLEWIFADPPKALVEQVEHLRTLSPEKGIYGGNGWANYAVAYFNDCYLFLEQLKYVMKPRAPICIVIGNSILQGQMIPTDRYLAELAQQMGFELVAIDIPRDTRVGNSIIQSSVRGVKASKKQRLYEAIVHLRDPKLAHNSSLVASC